MARADEIRLMTKVARLYYHHRLRQSEIVGRLDVSQPTVSRLLRRAQEEGIVRITVASPEGIHAELEERLQGAYGLKEAIVVESAPDDDSVVRDLGAAAAFYLATTLKPREVVGISSWSSTLLAMVDAMYGPPRISSVTVLQILGGVGSPSAEAHANHLTRRLASLVRGEAVFLPAPGVTGSAEARSVLCEDPYVKQAMALFDRVTIALVGIGSLAPSKLLASSGNVFSPAELRQLKEAGAAGDVCLRFFDADGQAVTTPLNERVIGMELRQLRRVPRSVGIAGGRRKFAAIRGALRGKWINVLITDRLTAERLVRDSGRRPA